MTWTFSLPREVQTGNALAYRHWRFRHADKLAWLGLLRSELLLRPVPLATMRRKVLIFSYRKRILDDDNLIAGAKHLRDCLTVVGLILDDNARGARVTYEQETVIKGRKTSTVITIEDDTA